MSENNKDLQEETIPEIESKAVIPIKFNKETIKLSFEEAQTLVQKGMKFDMIAADFEILKKLAKSKGKNVSEFILDLSAEYKEKRLAELCEKCGGDRDFAQHIIELESDCGEETRGFGELKENFPQIKTLEDLPESVIAAANIKGSLLLDEYLRYLHKEQTTLKESIKKQTKVNESVIGPFKSNKGNENPETAEFLRGLWRK